MHSDNPFQGHMPKRNLHSEDSLAGAMCCYNLTANCLGPKCMAWRWHREDGQMVTYIDDDGIEQGMGWCGIAAYPLIGEKAF